MGGSTDDAEIAMDPQFELDVVTSDEWALDPDPDHLVEHLGEDTGPDGRLSGIDRELPADRFIDRELSWLAFNERVLDLAEDPQVPLLERVRFVSIFASNLDEFFMVRVAGIKRKIAAGIHDRAASGLEPRQLMEAIADRGHELVSRHAELYTEQLCPALERAGIRIVRWASLRPADREPLDVVFAEEIFPVLTPLAFDPAHPFPQISGLSLNLGVKLTNPSTGKEHFARVKVPQTLPRLVRVGHQGHDQRADFVTMEDIIAAHLDLLFPGMEVIGHHAFRVTRNEDLDVDDDDTENLLAVLERELLRRRFGPAVRLEVAQDIDPDVAELLIRELGVGPDDVYRLPEPLDLRGLAAMTELDRSDLLFESFRPRTVPDLVDVDIDEDPDQLFAVLRDRDVLLHHPYDSFVTSVQAFVAAAAADPDVLAIKQTLYRTSGDSPIVKSLVDAANDGKQVLAIVEIKARFDEAANIEWSRLLEDAGVHVVYGLVGLKAHAKLSLVVRREAGGLRRYCHVGTGNYHPKTARLYEDFGVLTSDPAVASDLTVLFNQLSGFAPRSTYQRLLVAPRTARNGLLALIDEQVAAHLAGDPALIRIKVNALIDETIVDALYRASQARVPIDIVVRGACALRPGVPGLSETIRVRSILGRFLEHSRVFLFGSGHDPVAYIGSADVMMRNLDKRIEALVRIENASHITALSRLLDAAMSPQTSSWHLGPDGLWVRHSVDEAGELLHDLQTDLIASHRARSRHPVVTA